jgi:hypothetical protein
MGTILAPGIDEQKSCDNREAVIMEKWIFQEREKHGMRGESEKITPTRSNTFSAADRQDFSKQ